MPWGKFVSHCCLTLALAGCGTQQPPVAAPLGQLGAPGATLEGDNQKVARARLRAVIRDQSFLDHLPQSERPTAIFEPFSARMIVLYTVDDQGAAREAQASDLAESAVTREALRAVVEWNLSTLLRDPVSCTSHAVTEPARRHYYESSRLLLDKQWADLAAKVGTVVVAVPSHDTLFVACNPTPEILKKLAVIVQNTYPQASRPVSPSLLTWSADGWRDLPAP